LPKTVRKTLMPIEPKVQEVAAEFDPGRSDFLEALAAFLSRRYRVTVRAADWPPQSLPTHLQPRVEIVDQANQTVASGRDLAAIRATVETRDVRSDAWELAARHLERRGLKDWTFGDLDEAVVVEEVGGAPLYAYPGLATRESEVDLRLFRKREEAETASRVGVRKLAELVLAGDLRRVWKDLAGLARHLPSSKATGNLQSALQQMSAKLQTPTSSFLTSDVLQKSAYENLLEHALTPDPVFPLTEARFRGLLDEAKRKLPALSYQLGEWTRQILALRGSILGSANRYATLDQDLNRLAPADFLARTPYARLPHLLRYLRAVQIRAERAGLNPAKDAEKAKQLAVFGNWRERVPVARQEEFRWMLEEFRVSLFAQELGTPQPVSAQRLKKLEEG
jgi:ATP-dependent helicase HrpA